MSRRSKEETEELVSRLTRAWKDDKYIRREATLRDIGKWLNENSPVDTKTVKRWLVAAGHDISRFREKRTVQQIADILGESVSTVESNYDKYATKARRAVWESQEVEGVTNKQYSGRKQYLKRRLLSLADAYGYDADKIVSKVGTRAGTLDDWVNSKYLREIFEPILGGQKEYSDFFSIKNADISADNYDKVFRFNKLLSDAFPVKAEDFKDYDKWDDLLSDARKKAKHNFDSHMRKAGPRALAMLRDPAQVDYVFNMFLRAQIESLANKTPIKHLSHGAASFGPNSSGLTNAFNYFLEDASANTARGSAPVLENSPAYKLLKENQDVFRKFSDLRIAPQQHKGLWGDLKITDPKWRGQSIPFMSLSNEVKRTALNNAERAAMEATSTLRSVEPGQQLVPYAPEKGSIMNFRNNPTARNVGQNIWGSVKPVAKAVGKTALRAVPIAGAGVSLAQANEYRKAGQDKLAAAATMSAVPGPWGWAGLAGEMGGLLWNKATQDPNFLRGPLDKRRHIPRQRGSL